MFLARAFRLFAYQGCMRQELQIEVDNNTTHTATPAPTTPAPVALTAQPHTDADGTRWVTPEQMKAQFPDLF